MPTKRKLKPNIKKTKILEYKLHIDHRKTYLLSLCDNCCQSIWSYADSTRDKSRLFNNKWGSNNSKPRIWLTLNDYTPLENCDFCNGKSIKDFIS